MLVFKSTWFSSVDPSTCILRPRLKRLAQLEGASASYDSEACLGEPLGQRWAHACSSQDLRARLCLWREKAFLHPVPSVLLGAGLLIPEGELQKEVIYHL